MLIIEATNTKNINLKEASEYVNLLDLKIDTLESIGFKSLVFIKVFFNEALVENHFPVPIFGDNCNGYIVAIHKHGGLIHRINGFANNDFPILFFDSNRRVISRRKFLKSHRIEELDLKCLYKAWKSNSLDEKKFPCLTYCAHWSSS